MRDPDGYIYVKEEVGGLLVGGFEPVAKPWATDGIPEPFEFQLLPDDWDQFQILMENALTRLPALHDGRDQELRQRPRELHAGQQLHHRRGAGAEELLRRGGLQLDRHRLRRRRRPGARRVDRRRRALDRPVAGRHPPLRALQRQRHLAARARRRGARPALHDAVAEPRARFGAAVPALAALRPARRERRRVRVEDGLGAAELLRPQRGRAHDRLFLRAPELVRHRRGRAARRTPGRRGLRHDLVREAPGPGPRRRARAAAACRERRRRAGRRDASIPGSSTRAAPTRATSRSRGSRRTASCRHRHGAGDPRRRLDRAPHPRGRARDAHRRDLGLCGDRGDGAARRASSCRG